jgi:type II secretory pathway component PulJ
MATRSGFAVLELLLVVILISSLSALWQVLMVSPGSSPSAFPELASGKAELQLLRLQAQQRQLLQRSGAS